MVLAKNEDEFHEKVDLYSNSIVDRSEYKFSLNQDFNSEIGGGIFLVRGYKTNNEYEWQEFTSYSTEGVRHYYRSKVNGEWKGYVKS